MNPTDCMSPQDFYGAQACPECDGYGQVTELCGVRDSRSEIFECDVCKGKGEVEPDE